MSRIKEKAGSLGLAVVVLCVALASVGQAWAAFGRDGTEVLSSVHGLPTESFAYGKSKFLVVLDSPESKLMRFRSNGSIDRSFGENGRVLIPASSVVGSPGGKILVLGPGDRDQESGWDPTVTRLLPSGAVDRSFGHEGHVSVDMGGKYDDGGAIMLDAKGRLVIGGGSADVLIPRGPSPADPVITRLLPGGAPDRTFSGDGRVRLAGSSEGGIGNLRRGPHGSIYAMLGETLFPEFFKLRAGGGLDRDFGNQGSVGLGELEEGSGIDFISPIESFAVAHGGKIILAGTLSFTVHNQLHYRAVVLRVGSDGTLDESYGRDGFARARVGAWFFARSMLLQASGRLIVAGNSQRAAGHNSAFAAVAFDPDGRLDPSFGHRGTMRIEFKDAWALVSAIAPAPHRRAIMVGDASEKEGHPNAKLGFALARIDLVNSRRR